MIKVYAIKNCNTVKSALTWLQEHGIDYEFHDYKKLGISKQKLEQWCKQVDWTSLINKKGTTWRKLDKEIQEAVTTKAKAIEVMIENTSCIKRPIIEKDNTLILLGFNTAEYESKLSL